MMSIKSRLDELEDTLKVQMMATMRMSDKLADVSAANLKNSEYIYQMLTALEIMRYEINQIKERLGMDTYGGGTIH